MRTEIELADILDRCLDQVRAGAPVTDVLRRHPEEAEQLRPLLALAVGLELLPDPHYSQEGATRTIVKAAEEHKRDTATKATAPWFRFWRQPQAIEKPKKEAATARWFSFRPVQLLYRLAAVALIVLLVSWGAGVISADAVPGDFLYPLKRLSERARFYLTLNAEDKAELRIVFSSERLKEAVKKHARDGNLDLQLLQQMLEEARQAVEAGVALPEADRKLLAVQAAHLSRFQQEALEQVRPQLPPAQQVAVARYIDMCGKRAAWMRQMPSAERSQESGVTIPQWRDTCPPCNW